MNRIGFLASAAAAVFAVAECAAKESVDYVNPFVGTSAPGHTFPAASLPFGLVQAGPDSGSGTWAYCSGYVHEDDTVLGFSQTHLNGTGVADLGDVLIQPFSGKDLSYVERLHNGRRYVVGIQDKTKEIATPGYYAATITNFGVRAEATVTERVAIYRFTYEGEGPARLLVDTQYGIGRDPQYQVTESAVSLCGKTGLCGVVRRRRWVDRKVAFAVEFDREWESCEELPKTKGEKAPRYAFGFGFKRGETLLVKVAISAEGGTEGAKGNLKAEMPGWDFEGVRKAAREKWIEALDVARAEGSEEEKSNWYTALYHLFIQPNDISDAGAKPFYSTFSCWDTFRAAHPLYTIVCPERIPGMIDSMLEQGRRTGYLPIWSLWGVENQCMIGTHSVPVIVDAFLKGFNASDRGYWEGAYRQIRQTLTERHEGRRKENWDWYDKYGYYPFDLVKGESVSRTVECAYDDWCAAVMAEKLGYKEDAAFFRKRSSNWKNVFDRELGLVRGKDSNGNWRTPYDPYKLGHGAHTANDFTEGNAFQYSWHVMQDVPGLVEAMGGREMFVKRLDSLFLEPEKVEGAGSVVDVTGLIGQYVHGNEPSHHVIYFYPQVGEPAKAAERIRDVFDKFYLPKPDGLCGNDDCGQMSAWYVFSAMGFYPFNPCGGEYVIGAPQIPKAVLRLPGGKTFTVKANRLSRANKYVKSVKLNGKPLEGCILRHEEIMRGGELAFEMTSAAPARARE